MLNFYNKSSWKTLPKISKSHFILIVLHYRLMMKVILKNANASEPILRIFLYCWRRCKANYLNDTMLVKLLSIRCALLVSNAKM